MRINRIRLYNFSSYEGENLFDFSSADNKKNIVLIGGKNGAGKTSLFTAIKVALYGPLAYGYVGANSHYIAKIKELINSKAFQQNTVESEVQIAVVLKVEREIKEYVITRRWDYTKQKLNEEYFVEKEGERLSEKELSYFQNFLQSIVPPDLFEFFLFDGEEVGNIFATCSYNLYVKNAVFTLCGMDLFEIVRKQTKGYVSKSTNSDDENVHEEYEKIKSLVDEEILKKQQLEEKIVLAQQQIEEIGIQLSELETAFKNAGGITEQEKEVLENTYKAAEARKAEATAKIKIFVEGMMPFIILSDFTMPISRQLELEKDVETFNYVQERIDKEDIKKVLATLGNESVNTANVLFDMLIKKFMPAGYEQGNNVVFDLSKNEYAYVNGMLSSIDGMDKEEIVDAVNSRLEAAEQTAEINRKLKSSMAEEEVRTFTEKEVKLLKEKDKVISELHVAQQKLDELNDKIIQNTQTRDRLWAVIKENAQNKHVYELSSGLANMMSELLEQKTISLRRDLEQNIVENLNHIYRKNNLITHVEVTKEFQFNLYQDEAYTEAELLHLMKNLGTISFSELIGKQGQKRLFEEYNVSNIVDIKAKLESNASERKFDLYKKIELNRLSKGERQIFILALYWAIITISGQDIPFVIDTPYARIDANHRREISEKFFPNISKQVIILSTDEEINEEYYGIIKPYVAKEYLLVNDENQNRTSVENHYFFEV
ncbi:MAG: AAA family ATPase [Lachnospiraceae bacterium]|nr:AAA family ATPase [Lachnospiraceae bacterium]